MAANMLRNTSYSYTDSCFWQNLYVYPQLSSRVLKDSTHAVQVNCILFSKGQYTPRTKFENT
jgi:hypothetical protein